MNPPYTIGCANPKCLTIIGKFDEPPQPKTITCPTCGTQEMSICTVVEDGCNLATTVKETLAIFQAPEGSNPKKKFFQQTIIGDDYSHSHEKWVHKTRVIDKRNDHYHEKVTDPETGEVIHEQAHPLSEHQGHGCAKFKKP